MANSSVLQLEEGGDVENLESASQCNNDARSISGDSYDSFMECVNQLANDLESYCSVNSSKLDLVFYDDVQCYPKWLVSKKK